VQALPETVEISFARDIGNPAVAVIDTVTVIAVVRDKDGKALIDAIVEWRLEQPPGPVPLALNLGSLTPTGPLTAVMRLNEWKASVLAFTARPNQLPVWGRFDVSLGPPQRHMFIWSRESGFSRIAAPAGSRVYPEAINNVGQVVGSLQFPFSKPSWRAFIWSAATGFVLLPSPLGNSGNSLARSINDAGTVTGWVESESSRRMFTWNVGSGMSVVSNTSWSLVPPQINGPGQIAGDADGRAYRWTGATGLQFLPVLPENPGSYAVSINDAGDILGYDGVWDDWDPMLLNTAPVLWTADGARTTFANCSRPCGISVAGLNNQGQVAGATDGLPFRWSAKDGFARLPTGGAVLGINEAGDILLATWINTNVSRASLWTSDGKLIDLGMPPDAQQFGPQDLNDRGQVVGYVR
jgi:uncharacterized membrane protein